MILRIVALAIGGLVAACSQEPATLSEDWVLTNGRIYTVDEDQPWADAVVIRDGIFVYVGDDAGAQAYIRLASEIMDRDATQPAPQPPHSQSRADPDTIAQISDEQHHD